MKLAHKYFHGFTLIELLAVITIIGILATLAAVGVSNASKRARDGRRKSDLAQIRKALNQFELDNGYLPTTTSYGEVNAGGWDYSSQGNFMTFLVTGGYMSKVPVDPINNGLGDGNGYAYAYYCYPNGTMTLRTNRLEYKSTGYYYAANLEPGHTCQ